MLKHTRLIKHRKSVFLLFGLAALIAGCYNMRGHSGGGLTNNSTRTINPGDVALPAGYTIEPVAQGLTFPAGITFDDEGNIYVVEAGYSYGEVFTIPRLIRISADGKKTIIAEGEKNGPWTGVDFYEGNFYVSEGGQLKGGKILRITPNGKITALVEELPSIGDHHTNGVTIGPDGYIYFGQGVATNSGVVGKDNYDFGWLKRYPDFHDTPCRDIKLNGQNFTTDNVLTENDDDKAVTGAFVPFGTPTTKGQVIKGSIPCSGSIMRIPAGGGELELVAWGLRNPFGLAFDSNGSLYVTDNGFDDRGSRPVWGTADYLWKIESGTWYGWPDFSGGLPLTLETFDVPKKDDPKPLLMEAPNDPPKPVARLDVHSSSNGIDFSTNPAFGYLGEAFIAQFGDMAPGVGKIMSPVGYRIIRVNTTTGVAEEFAANKGKTNGPASWLEKGGLERPVAVKFSPDGKSLYVVDFGIMNMSEEGPLPRTETGVIWKITKK